MPRAVDLATILVPHGLLGCVDADFPRFARGFRSELAPRNLLEGLQVDLAILALTLLRRAMAALAGASTLADANRAQRSVAQAHAMLRQALREFNRLRKPAKEAKPAAPAEAAAPPTPEPAEAAEPATAKSPAEPPANSRPIAATSPPTIPVAIARPMSAALSAQNIPARESRCVGCG